MESQIKWIGKISWKKVLLSGVIFTVISFIIRQVEVIFTMKYYIMPEYFGLWSKLMMPSAGPPPPEFMATSLVFSLVTGISLTIIYYYLKDHLPKETRRKVFYFADLMMATSFVFFTLPVYLIFNIPFALLLSWLVTTFISLIAAAYIIVRIIG